MEKGDVKISDKIKIFIRYNTWKKLYNLIVTGIMIFFRKTYSYNYPIVVYIEPTNICNLHCPGCPTGVGIPSNREKNTLKLKQFKFFLDQIKDFVYSINFSNWGEPLLHPDILSMIEYAHRNHIRTCMDTNFNINISEKKQNQ